MKKITVLLSIITLFAAGNSMDKQPSKKELQRILAAGNGSVAPTNQALSKKEQMRERLKEKVLEKKNKALQNTANSLYAKLDEVLYNNIRRYTHPGVNNFSRTQEETSEADKKTTYEFNDENGKAVIALRATSVSDLGKARLHAFYDGAPAYRAFLNCFEKQSDDQLESNLDNFLHMYGFKLRNQPPVEPSNLENTE